MAGWATTIRPMAPERTSPGRRIRQALVLALAAILAVPNLSTAAPHDHGAAQLQLALEGDALTMRLQLPQDGLVGFEHAPRTPAQRQALADALARLRDVATVIEPDAAARCHLTVVDVKDPHAAPGASAAGGDAHADIEVAFAFRCARPDQLGTVRIGLLEAFARLKRVQAVVAVPQGQRKLTLRRPARELKLPR